VWDPGFNLLYWGRGWEEEDQEWYFVEFPSGLHLQFLNFNYRAFVSSTWHGGVWIFSTFYRPRQKDCAFKVILGYIARSRLKKIKEGKKKKSSSNNAKGLISLIFLPSLPNLQPLANHWEKSYYSISKWLKDVNQQFGE
jgi:hypothetical protein